MSNELFATLLLLFSLLGLGLVWHLFVKELQRDAFRQRVFALRDELFDYIASENLGFDHPAYIHFRTLFNGAIRFSNRIRLFDLLVLRLLGKRLGFTKENGDEYQAELLSLLNGIGEEQTRKHFEQLHLRFTVSLVWLVVSTSLPLLAFASITLLLASIYLLMRSGLQSAGRVGLILVGKLTDRQPAGMPSVLEAYSFVEGGRFNK
ncbi:MAG: hypothetical protein FJY67_06765 [Calditrichaeota bacterium]|nr:hypothetical protein [Calditrichota bacterium]